MKNTAYIQSQTTFHIQQLNLKSDTKIGKRFFLNGKTKAKCSVWLPRK